MTRTPIIGVDWGSTNLRAFRFDAEGAISDVRRSARDSAALARDGFERVLLDLIKDWLSPAPKIIICGMAGSREGWIEAPYASCPCDVEALARAMIRAPADVAEIWIAPGAMSTRDDGRVDVMRGEETQILGMVEAQETPLLVITPGTHSKWARVEGGRLIRFRTYMTGELFAVLKAHSILGRTMRRDAAHAADTFDLGVARALEDSGLLNLLFSVRTEGLFGRIAPEAASSYLSGLLIGAEIAEATQRTHAQDTPILVIAAPELAARYRRALRIAGVEDAPVMDGEQAAARGLWRLAQAAS